MRQDTLVAVGEQMMPNHCSASRSSELKFLRFSIWFVLPAADMSKESSFLLTLRVDAVVDR